VALYARVSTKEQKTTQQVRDLRAYCKARGWQVVDEYIDHAVSGKKASRPAMDRLMDAARQRKIDAVAVVKIDRWGRSIKHFVSSVQELSSLGVRFVAISQGIDTGEDSAGGKLLMTILAAFAEFEHDIIVERTLAGLAEARRNGHVGGRRHKIVDRARVKDLHAQGWGVRRIAKAVAPSVDGGITHTTIARILKEAA
jgi:DNA invertase Pin-like site-specific DNA recombinase